MKVPNAEAAIVDIRKLSDYCLSSEHPRGKHKARVFAASLGLTADDAEFLKDILLEAVQTEDATLGEQDEYGQRYTVDTTVITEAGMAVVRSGWILRTDDDIPHLTTCFVV